eukprot:jgi/Astpho2/2210/Aster-x1057
MPIQPSRYKHLAPTSCKEAINKWPERYTGPSREELSQLAQEDFVKITFLDKEEVWVYVESLHEDYELIFGRLCTPCHILGYQKDSRQVTVRQIVHRD